MSSVYRDFTRGSLATVATIPANFPFGLIVGVAAVNVGISVTEITAMSALTFAGASQLAVIDLLREDASLGVVLLTAFLINIRYVMYSASIATYVEDLSRPWRWIISFFLLDITYAVAVTAYENESVSRGWFFVGAALPVWISWILGTIVGALAGTSLPASWQLDFAVPLLFLALLVPTLESRAKTTAAVVGGIIATLGTGLPYNLGLLSGALGGIASGVALERSGLLER